MMYLVMFLMVLLPTGTVEQIAVVKATQYQSSDIMNDSCENKAAQLNEEAAQNVLQTLDGKVVFFHFECKTKT